MAPRIQSVPRSELVQRRYRNIGFTIIAIGLLLTWFMYQRQNLQRDSFGSGYLLIGAVLFLASYNLRKKLPAIAWLGSSAAWMQLHIYVAIASFVVFAWHVGLEMPNGIFECSLAAMYLIVFGSGLLGLFWTRTIPRRLTAVGDQVIFEQIPVLRRQVIQQARTLLFETPALSPVLGRFYLTRLATFFERGRSITYLLRPSGRTCRSILGEIEDLDRYLSGPHRETGRRLAQLVRRKDDLDYHLALQGRLKIWLFLHIGLTYSLVIVAIVHGVTAHAFHGGLR